MRSLIAMVALLVSWPLHVAARPSAPLAGVPLARASLPAYRSVSEKEPPPARRAKVTRAQRISLQGLLLRERRELATLQRRARDVVEAEVALARAQQEERTLRYRGDEAARKAKALQRREGEAEERARARLLRLYKLSRGRYARALAAAPNAAELTRRARLLRFVVQRDLDELSTFVRERRAQEAERASVARAIEATRAERERLKKLATTLKSARDAQRRAVDQLARRRRRKQRLVGALSRVSRRLIAEVGRTHRALRRGRLDGSCRVAPVAGWLARAKKGASSGRQGVVWRTGRRRKVVAPLEGLVRAVREVDGLGRVVLIEHEGGLYTLYGFLSAVQVEVGQRVAARARLGRTGIDPLGGKHALYFELRRGAEAGDTEAWARRCPRR